MNRYFVSNLVKYIIWVSVWISVVYASDQADCVKTISVNWGTITRTKRGTEVTYQTQYSGWGRISQADLNDPSTQSVQFKSVHAAYANYFDAQANQDK